MAEVTLETKNRKKRQNMPKTTIHPPGDKMQKALREFSALLEEKPEMDRRKLLEKIVIKYDLSPKECDFFERHFTTK